MRALLRYSAFLGVTVRSFGFFVQQHPTCLLRRASLSSTNSGDMSGVDTSAFVTAITATPDVLPKVFESALAIIPPDDVWPALQRARVEQRDAGLLRWPPHANILYPFVPVQHFEKLGPLLADALSDLPPFTVTLARFDSFDRKDSSVLYLVPEVTSGPPDSLDQLYKQVAAVAPYCAKPHFTPHITVTHTAGAEASAAARASLEEWWEPISFVVDQLHCISRKGPNKPYECRWRVPLGSSSSSGASSMPDPSSNGSALLGANAPATEASCTTAGAMGCRVDDPYPGMIEDVEWISSVRGELASRRKRGMRRKHQNSAAGKVSD